MSQPIYKHSQGQGSQLHTDAGVEMSVSPFTNTHRDSGHSCRQMQVLRWVSAHSQTLTGTGVTAAYRCRCWDECRPIHKHTQGQGSQLQTDAGVEMSVSLITTTHGGSYKGRQMQVLRRVSTHSHTQGQGSQLQTDAGAEVSVSLITTTHGGSCKGRQLQVLRWVSVHSHTHMGTITMAEICRCWEESAHSQT